MKIYLVMGEGVNYGDDPWVQEAWTTRELAEEGAKALRKEPHNGWDVGYFISELEVKGE